MDGAYNKCKCHILPVCFATLTHERTLLVDSTLIFCHFRLQALGERDLFACDNLLLILTHALFFLSFVMELSNLESNKFE